MTRLLASCGLIPPVHPRKALEQEQLSARGAATGLVGAEAEPDSNWPTASARLCNQQRLRHPVIAGAAARGNLKWLTGR
ncbi:hypothetical protein P7K49_029672 [Saguinus oedipus]|uniref:Uncharacterized protein n=1 Tax=Saguinus oedipus TaxID=9490 RepID=A0ABQ9U939_SAGOE|nr:hypothetical protein P7K49_029672 [Saguinus oedipus]